MEFTLELLKEYGPAGALGVIALWQFVLNIRLQKQRMIDITKMVELIEHSKQLRKVNGNVKEK